MPLASRFLLALFLAAAVSLAACGGDGSDPAGGSDAGADAAAPGRDASRTDTPVGVDGTVPDVRADVPSAPADVVDPPEDVVVPPEDVVDPPSDVVAPPEDVVVPPADVVVPPEDVVVPEDTVPVVPLDNFLENGGFEQWSDGLPVAWYGEASSLSSESVAMTSDDPHEGQHACRLSNDSDNHRRFTTVAYALAAGDYRCTYWARGWGQVRNAHYHGLEGNGYSSYTSYHDVRSATWEPLAYEFRLPEDSDVVELIFSLRLTDPADGDLELDDVVCGRLPSPCDDAQCDEWARCDLNTGDCVALSGRCVDDGDCWSYEVCLADHTCGLAPGRCESTADCDVDGPTPLCDRTSHTCVAGDPCGDVTCDEWKVCAPATGRCVLRDGRCDTTADCLGAAPACDRTDHTCYGADHAANLVYNGGFEEWGEDPWGDRIPLGWFGMDIPGSTEIDPENVLPWTDAPHGGLTACQIVGVDIAERFTSEAFDIPSGRYTCGYWARGYGQLRHRTYSSGGWSPETDRVTIESETWQPFFFAVDGNVRDFRIIFYASYTDPARGHLQLDDVVCTLD